MSAVAMAPAMAVSAALIAVAVAATLIPARRASAVNAVKMPREE